MDLSKRRRELLATEHLPWLAHLSTKYQMPAAQLARQLSPGDLVQEIAFVLNETGRTSAQRLYQARHSEDPDTSENADREIILLEDRPDLLARLTRLYLERYENEREEQEEREAEAELSRLQLMQLR